MQTLIFNTTEKYVVVKESFNSSDVLMAYKNVPTVRVYANFYEVIQKINDTQSIPVFRAPIANTNMVIVKND